MSDFFSFSNINTLALIGAAATILFTLIALAIYFKSIKNQKSSGELSEGNWDGIKEYKNPLPLGWAVVFLVLCLWGIYYMYAPAGTPYAYPLNAYSQLGEYVVEVNEHNAKFDSKWQNADQATLKSMGESIYMVQCSQCHGLQGDGIDGTAADLRSWGTQEGILSTVLKGSKGLNYSLSPMTPLLQDGLIESEDQAKLAIEYLVKYVSKTKPLSANDEMSKAAEAEAWNVCAACHGMDGMGMEGAAPDLTKYGKSAFVVEVLNRGKHGDIGNMPAFNDGRLTDVQKEAVGTYVLSIGR